jgi:hypothetical protein
VMCSVAYGFMIVFQGAPARGAVVSLTDSAGRVQKRAIDAGRYNVILFVILLRE